MTITEGESKYELTDQTITVEGHILHRIKAVGKFRRRLGGAYGGWIESGKNLSHSGKCWIFDDAMVYGDARVCDDAKVSGDAKVFDNAQIHGQATVREYARIGGYAEIKDKADISGWARVYGHAIVNKSAKVYGNALVNGRASVMGRARIYGQANINGDALVCDNAKVRDFAMVYGNAEVSGDSLICGGASVSGFAHIEGCSEINSKASVHESCTITNAVINSHDDYMVFTNCWSSGRTFVYTRSNDKWCVGCFYGTGEELIRRAYGESDLKGKCYEAVVTAVRLINIAIKKEAKQ